jgi:hypothetical protein
VSFNGDNGPDGGSDRVRAGILDVGAPPVAAGAGVPGESWKRQSMALQLALAFLLLPAIAADAQASQRRFKQADYETYFTPGRYETASQQFRSRGDMEVLSVRATTVGGVRMLQHSVRTLQVAQNYDALSEYPFYKVQSLATDAMVWDSRLAAYVFEFSDEAFQGDRSQVWESQDERLGISPNDRERGALQAFYAEADRRAGLDANAQREEHRRNRVGQWSRTCAYLVRQPWEVACAFRHVPSGVVETYSYRRADRIS